MAGEINMSEVVNEVKNANEEELKSVIEGWYQRTRTDGLKLGAKMICMATANIIKKHTKKVSKVSLNDYKRMTSEILELISVQLAERNDSEEMMTEENENDRTTESNDNTNS